MGGGLNEVGLPGKAARPALRLLRPARHKGQLNARHKKTARLRRCRFNFRRPIPALDFASAGAD